jgi:kynurenine formamidase
MDEEVADYLKASGKKGVGVDVMSLDPVADEYLTTHRRLFKDSDLVVVENLKNLGCLGNGLFTFIALPLNHKDGDGSPTRAIAILDE